MSVPATLNGYKVIRSEFHPNGVHTIMAQNHHEFAVASWSVIMGNQWYLGTYFPFTKDTMIIRKKLADDKFAQRALIDANR